MDSEVARLQSQAESLLAGFKQGGESSDIEKAIVLGREALGIPPSDTPIEWHGATEDLDEAIVLGREALDLSPPGHPDRTLSLINLANCLSHFHNQHGATHDLDEAILLLREALDLSPQGHRHRSVSLNNLAGCLSLRFNQRGAIEDLDEAIILGQEALDLRPPGHPDRAMSLNNLALYLYNRHHGFGAIEDLDEAITFGREALRFSPPGHVVRPMSLNNLTNYFSVRYNRDGATEDLNNAIVFSREALVLRSPGHPDRPMSLNNLAHYLSTRYEGQEAIEDLDEVIILSQHLTFWPLDSDTLFDQRRHGAIEDRDDAIILGRETLDLRLPGHPHWSGSLHNLAFYLSALYRESKRLEDEEEVFSLYTLLTDVSQIVSSTDLLAVKGWINEAEYFQHEMLLLAYETSLRLLIQHLATLPSLPQHLSTLKNLASSLAADAFSACLRSRTPTKAVELLEQGRGVFWSQLTRLHSPLEDVIASGPAGEILADQFSRLASRIRDAFNSPGADQHGRVYFMNVEMQKVVTEIRKLPGLSRFLLPSLFSDLRCAAKKGPIVVVNASQYGCDALVIVLDRDPVHIPLPITRQGVRGLSKELHTLTTRAKRANVTKELVFFLRKLWDEVVSRVVDFLRTTLPTQSRIWWCPTAEFSLLPLHAVGPYRTGQRNLADIYISSYTPTLTALIRARRYNPSDLLASGKHFVAIGQANASGESKLLSVGTELDRIDKVVGGRATFVRIDGEDSSIARVVEGLGRSEWVHLACHGLANLMQSFESVFALHDGRFTIQRIIGCEWKHPEFVYLSACHTTVGYEEGPDEVIHLAAAMQFVGFCSVIGTMWAVDDAHTSRITSTFYQHMMDEFGRLDHTRAAYALNKTMRSIRIPLDQKIPYIHLGA